jgi:thiol-disulfide isomerase/thioredoxin
MKFKFITFLTILSLTILTGCDSKDEIKTTNKDNTSKQSTQDFPMFNLQTSDGKTITLQATDKGITFKGMEDKAVLLDFFATWCPPCKAEIPHLNNLRKRYEGKFEIIGVLLEEGKSNDEISSFITQFDIKYPIANSVENFVLAQAVGGVKSIPTMFLFGPNGKIIEKYVGMVPEEMLASDIDKALEKK